MIASFFVHSVDALLTIVFFGPPVLLVMILFELFRRARGSDKASSNRYLTILIVSFCILLGILVLGGLFLFFGLKGVG